VAKTSFTKPIVVISKCLTRATCRWDGERLSYPFAGILRQYARLVPVCPEIEIGLGCPREKILIVDQEGVLSLHQPITGRTLTRRMNAFAKRHLAGLLEVDGFLLKSESPSCGIRDTKRFESADESARRVGYGPGLYATGAVQTHPTLPIEDEKRLESHTVREHWLTRLYLLAAFRSLRKRPSVGRLTTFYNHNVVLLEAYNKKQTAQLNYLMAIRPAAPTEAFLADYEALLHRILKRPARPKAIVANMAPAYEHYAGQLNRADRQKYRQLAERCANGEVPVNDLRQQIQVWAVRYDKNFIREHSLYRPYPGPLASA